MFRLFQHFLLAIGAACVVAECVLLVLAAPSERGMVLVWLLVACAAFAVNFVSWFWGRDSR